MYDACEDALKLSQSSIAVVLTFHNPDQQYRIKSSPYILSAH